MAEINITPKYLKDAGMVVIIIALIPILFLGKKCKTKKQQILEDKVDYCKLKKTIAPIIAVVPDVTYLLEQISMTSGTW